MSPPTSSPQSAPPISSSFATLKSHILSSLSPTDPSTYTDASPKGSVDAGIRGLIDRINALEGVVTTSSCAGRVSVFLEGSKGGEGVGWEGGDVGDDEVGNEGDGAEAMTVVPGGKGRGGRWLYVSHELVPVPEERSKGYFGGMFILQPAGDAKTNVAVTGMGKRRFVRFQFEPFVRVLLPQFHTVIRPSLLSVLSEASPENLTSMNQILHIATSSLHHAKPLLAAALNAGFRESGIQSLKTLTDPSAIPMLAIRTAGLGLSSLIGVYDSTSGEDAVRSLVSEEYLEILVGMANERFVANSERVERFERELFTGPWGLSGPRKMEGWEDGDARRERKRKEGLAKKEAIRAKTEDASNGVDEGNEDAADLADGAFVSPEGLGVRP